MNNCSRKSRKVKKPEPAVTIPARLLRELCIHLRIADSLGAMGVELLRLNDVAEMQSAALRDTLSSIQTLVAEV